MYGKIAGSGGGVRAVGTIGAPLQARGVVGRAWKYGDCSADNYASRTNCHRCKAARPAGDASSSSSGAADDAGPASPWREALDPRTHQIYYWNALTRETAWARPQELGPAPHGTGFFGRGAATGVDVQGDAMRRNATWLQRPARKQSDFDPRTLQRAEGSNEYNIWFGRYVGDYSRGGHGKDPAPTRCVPETDAGFTKASRGGATSDRASFCIHFVRGACHRGSECTYYHHVPTAEDDGLLPPTHDVFGRERHTTHRDDMRGTGDINSDCRTLFVGGLKKLPGYDVRAALEAHFGAWGELENVNVIDKKAIAFVRYRCRANSEFAMEAMSNQALDQGEVLNIRWAYDDPNPVARNASARADADALLAAMYAKGSNMASADFAYPETYALPEFDSSSVRAGGVNLPLDALSAPHGSDSGRSGAMAAFVEPARQLVGGNSSTAAAATWSGNAATSAADSSHSNRPFALYPDTSAQYDQLASSDAAAGLSWDSSGRRRDYVVAEPTPLLQSYGASPAYLPHYPSASSATISHTIVDYPPAANSAAVTLHSHPSSMLTSHSMAASAASHSNPSSMSTSHSMAASAASHSNPMSTSHSMAASAASHSLVDYTSPEAASSCSTTDGKSSASGNTTTGGIPTTASVSGTSSLHTDSTTATAYYSTSASSDAGGAVSASVAAGSKRKRDPDSISVDESPAKA